MGGVAEFANTAAMEESDLHIMSAEHFETNHVELEAPRSVATAMMNGARCKCPSCGQTKLFQSGLKVHDTCSECGEELHHHRADDLPAYLNIFIVGHVVVGIMMMVFIWNLMDMWSLMAVTIAASILIAVFAMRPLKGMVVGAQWALRMHGFGNHDD